MAILSKSLLLSSLSSQSRFFNLVIGEMRLDATSDGVPVGYAFVLLSTGVVRSSVYGRGYILLPPSV